MNSLSSYMSEAWQLNKIKNDKEKQPQKETTSFFIKLWSDSLAKFLANIVVLLLMIFLVRFFVLAYDLLLKYSKNSFVVIKLNKFLFESLRITDLLTYILSLWLIISLAVISIDYFIIYPIRCRRMSKKK